METPAAPEPRVVSAGPEHTAGLEALFSACNSACHCRWWHFSGDKNGWLERCAHYPELNRQELQQALSASDAATRDTMLGVVALMAERVVGWMKLAPWSAMQKLANQRPYRGLPCFTDTRQSAYVIGCVLVAADFRRRGISRALLAGAEELARSRGAGCLEAFPRQAPDLGDEELWLGAAEIFHAAGFSEIERIGPYPVLRKILSPPPTQIP